MNYFQNLEKFMVIEDIRFFKLMEIIQYSILGVLFTTYFSNIIENSFPEFDDKKKTYVIFNEIIIQLSFIIVVGYYIRKFIVVIPFVFIPIINYFNINYKCSKKNEALIGVLIGMSYVFLSTQYNFTSKIIELSDRFSSYNSYIIKKLFNL